MDFTYDEEQLALRDAVRGLLTKAYGDFVERRAAVRTEPGYSADAWSRLAEMGVLGLPFAEDDGGMGAGPVEVGLVAEEMGRVLAPEPFLTGVVQAGGLVTTCGSAEQRAAVLGGAADGGTVLAAALLEPGGGWRLEPTGTTASYDRVGWTLHGVKEPVPYAVPADRLVVTAGLPEGGCGVFLVDPAGAGVTVDGWPAPDGTPTGRVRLDAAVAEPLGEPVDRASEVALATALTRIAAAQEAVGAMDAALGHTREYLTSRKQFGVTLNTFQALKFRAADMYVDLELSRSLALWAVMVAADGDPAATVEAADRAWLQVARAGRRVTEEAVQLHGGIGVTAEHRVGHYLSRVTALQSLLGSADAQLGRLAAAVGAHPEVDPLT